VSHKIAKFGGVVGVVANCITCGKRWESKNAHAVGFNHAKNHGHEVVVEKILSFKYEPI